MFEGTLKVHELLDACSCGSVTGRPHRNRIGRDRERGFGGCLKQETADEGPIDPSWRPGAILFDRKRSRLRRTRTAPEAKGSIEIGRKGFSDDESWHGRGAAKVEATSIGAIVWRWEFAAAQSRSAMLEQPNGTSVEKLARLVLLPTSDILMRNDSVSFPPGGCAFMHTHQGPGSVV